MAITTNTLESTPRHEGSITGFVRINASSADASGCETILAAPGSGYELLLKYIRVIIGGAITVDIGSGKKGTACEKVILGPMGGAAMSVQPFDFGDEPVVLDPNKALTVDASGAGRVCIYAEVLTRIEAPAGVPSASLSSSISSSVSASAS